MHYAHVKLAQRKRLKILNGSHRFISFYVAVITVGVLTFRQFITGTVNHIVNSAEMMNRFKNVVDRHAFTDIQRIRLKNQTGLILGKTASLNLVGVVGRAHLQLVIKPTDYSQSYVSSWMVTGKLRTVTVHGSPITSREWLIEFMCINGIRINLKG